MKLVNDMPNCGRFIAVWFHEETGELWSDTLEWKHGVLMCYCDAEGNFESVANSSWYRDNAPNFVIGE